MSKLSKLNGNLSKLNLDLSETISMILLEKSKVNHHIQYENRLEIFEWTSNVSDQLNINQKTFFQAIEMFDSIIEKMNYPDMDFDRMKVFAIVCLMMSSKLEEVNFISIDNALRALNEYSSTKEELKEIEICILFSLKFQFPKNLFEEFSYLTLHIIFHETCISQNIDIIHHAIIDFYKLIFKNSEFLGSKDIVSLYFAIIFFFLKNKFDSTFLNQNLEYINSFFDLSSNFANKDSIIEYASEIQKAFFDEK